MGEDTLKSLFPSLFPISTFTSRPIANFAVHTQEEGYTTWNLHFSRNLLDREITQLQDLLWIIDRIHLCNRSEDTRTWIADSSGTFTCKSAFSQLRKDNSFPVNKQNVFGSLLFLSKLR